MLIVRARSFMLRFLKDRIIKICEYENFYLLPFSTPLIQYESI